jgi:hypothetical protein
MEIGELEIALFLYGGNMEYIQRPKKVSRQDKQVISEKQFRENTDKQFENVYNKLDEIVKAENYVPEPEPEVVTEETLYTGASASPTLSKDVKNFKELDIYYRCNRDAYFYGKKTIPIVSGASKFTLVDMVTIADEDVIKGTCATYSVSATKISVVYAKQFEFSNGGLVAMNKINSYAITKVIGKY